MKYLDKFLKVLKTDRNTFFTYILTLITAYIVVDRIVEMLFLIFTGISLSYWGPIKYTLALACPVFAFLFSGSSSFASAKLRKYGLFYSYCISLFIIFLSMVEQWANAIEWILFISVPNYAEIVQDFPELIRPAFQALSLYLPLISIYPLFKFIYCKVNDSKLFRDSITDYKGINLNPGPKNVGPYTCEVALCTNTDTGATVKIPEIRRFETSLIVGVSGSGKTSMVFEPLIARDLEKKAFFKDVSKEMGFTALKTGIATINTPYTNEYLNKNFNLNMLVPKPGKEKLLKAYLSKMTVTDNVYKDLGLTYLAPDYESAEHIIKVAKNFHIPINLIDPSSNESIGLNPFIYDDPSKTAIAISTVIKGMYGSTHNHDLDEAFKEDVSVQAIENLSILLKTMYPRLHNGDLPNLEDMLKMLNNFELVENMCKELEKDKALANKYHLQLSYFKKNFYSDGIGRNDTEKYIYPAATQLDNLLRLSGVRDILCNRVNNMNFDKALSDGEVTIICTRRGDLGATAHKAFGLFALLIMQYSVLRRPGNENTRIPHFLYVDEFPDFLCSATECLFTLYRKYRVGIIISAQNIRQFDEKYSTTVLSNSSTKVVFGNNTWEDNEWWSKEFGKIRDWKMTYNYQTDKGTYDSKIGIRYDWKQSFEPGNIQSMGFKSIRFKTKNAKGSMVVGPGKVDFLDAKYKKVHEVKNYNFAKYLNNDYASNNSNIESNSQIKSVLKRKKSFNPSNVSFENTDNPIHSNPTSRDNIFNGEDPIINNK